MADIPNLKVPQVYATVENMASEGESAQLCIHVNGTLQKNVTLLIQTVDGSAVGKIQYRVELIISWIDSIISNIA